MARHIFILMLTLLFLPFWSHAQPGQYQSKKYMDKEGLAEDVWKSCNYLLYFYETDKRFKITIHKPDSLSDQPTIVAEIVVSKRKRKVYTKKTYYYSYRGHIEDRSYEVKIFSRKFQRFILGKVDEGRISIIAEINGIPYYQTFWCERINKATEFKTFDEM